MTFLTSFFTTVDGEWFVPNEECCGPWDPAACHAGPPTAMIARALERVLPSARLTRITVDLDRPVPMAGFRVVAEVVRSGRTVSATRASLLDTDGKERVRAVGSHLAIGDLGSVATTAHRVATLAESAPGGFPIERGEGTGRGFPDAVEIRYPPGEGPGLGPTTMWMRAIPLLPDEEPTPFQRICPLADCSNAMSRNAAPTEMQFMNTDLTITLHRDPVGEWLGSQAVGRWEPTGIGFADALLFDDVGVVGRACQTLVLRRPLGS